MDLDDTTPIHLKHGVDPPFRGSPQIPGGAPGSPDAPGSFRIRDLEATIEDGWDVRGEWDVDDEQGVVLLNVSLVPSEYVLDGPPSGQPRLRKLPEERPRGGWRSGTLRRIRTSVIYAAIRARLDDPFFQVEEGKKAGDVLQRQLDVIAIARDAKPLMGKPRTSDAQLDQWAMDVIDVLEKGGPLYKELMARWDVGESTVKNSRLPLLRDTNHLVGRGRGMQKGPNYPREEPIDG